MQSIYFYAIVPDNVDNFSRERMIYFFLLISFIYVYLFFNLFTEIAWL